jgi:uncharacterized membrane protein
MKKEPFVTEKHIQIKSTLRTVGPILLIIGGLCVVIAFVDFFSASNSFEGPKYFWLAFVGMPFLAAGSAMTKAGYAQDAAKYMSREMAPVTSETFNYLAEETQEGVETITKAIQRGKTEVVQAKQCSSCLTLNILDAKFCNECGQSL